MQHGPDWCLSITKDCFIFKDFFMGIIFSAGNWFNPKFAVQPFSGVINMSLKQMIEYIYIFKRRYMYIYTLHETIPACVWQINEIVLYISKSKYTCVSKLVSDFFRPVFAYIYTYIYNECVCVYIYINIHIYIKIHTIGSIYNSRDFALRCPGLPASGSPGQKWPQRGASGWMHMQGARRVGCTAGGRVGLDACRSTKIFGKLSHFGKPIMHACRHVRKLR